MVAEAGPSLSIAALGWIGQACFFSRFFLQWLESERAKRSVVPRAFWWLSLAGAILMGGYAINRGTMLLLFGYVVSTAIALRNLGLQGRRGRFDPRWTALAAVAIVGTSVWIEFDLMGESSESQAWLLVGGVGQTLWLTRFPLQWWLSEREGQSHFPRAFWWVSLAGNGFLLAYALHLGDPVFVLGFLPGPFLQARNLMLSHQRLSTA